MVLNALQYGKDSTEYQMGGGVRKRDRIRRGIVNLQELTPFQKISVIFEMYFSRIFPSVLLANRLAGLNQGLPRLPNYGIPSILLNR